jgi:DNA-binding transcriptional LysR family regulator
MRSINLDQLRALETVIELASFTAAAKRLNLSQSTISVQIKELEKRFGVRLVERLGKRAAPTSAGRELIDHARRITADVELADMAMQRHRDGSLGQVKVGATTTALSFFLSPILESLRRRHPNIDLSIVVDTTAAQVDRILNEEIDFGLVNLPVKERLVQVIPLRAEQLVAIFPADTPNVPRHVTPEFMARHRLLLEAARAQV